ncbi:MAG TPA: hypothetical protein VMU51_08800 [Mycobacteriales bacterium]|nr:hypothetical protein [Mycobacteriales bacterium]
MVFATRQECAALAAILIGLPVIAYTGGWLLAGKETPTSARQTPD